MTEIIQQYLKDDIEFVRASDWHETILFYEDDGVTAKDTTDWTLTMTIQKSPNGEVFDTLETDGARIVNTPSNGQFNLNLTAAEVEAYDFTSAVYRMTVDYGDGNVQVFRLGNVRII
jgi:hypothetical protein